MKHQAGPVLLSSLGCFALALGVAATSLLWSLIANWLALLLLIPFALVALAAYLNFGPKPKPTDEDRP